MSNADNNPRPDPSNGGLLSIFKDHEGRIVIGQPPNPPLYVAAVFFVVRFLPFDAAGTISFFGFTFAMLYWSYLELFHGVNTFRRILGLLVGGFFLISLLQRFSA